VLEPFSLFAIEFSPGRCEIKLSAAAAAAVRQEWAKDGIEIAQIVIEVMDAKKNGLFVFLEDADVCFTVSVGGGGGGGGGKGGEAAGDGQAGLIFAYLLILFLLVVALLNGWIYSKNKNQSYTIWRKSLVATRPVKCQKHLLPSLSCCCCFCCCGWVELERKGETEATSCKKEPKVLVVFNSSVPVSTPLPVPFPLPFRSQVGNFGRKRELSGS
jgi:hypothetical protein